MARDIPDDGLFVAEDGKERCFWCRGDEEYIRYHDEEWGWPVDSNRRLFEKICLEGFQSGLSWLTILRKRDNFRKAFANFQFAEVAEFDDSDVERLLQDAGIVRHRRKIESTINNARRALELTEEFGSLAAYFWQYEPAEAGRPSSVTLSTLRSMTKSSESASLAKDLKSRGWSFIGPTTAYAFMQSVGLVNDHITGCATRELTLDARSSFTVPS